MSEFSDAVHKLEITAEFEYLGETFQDTWRHDLWDVTLNYRGASITVPYRTGVGHREHGLAVDPDVSDVLYCLISDGSAVNQSFEDWCWTLGYDTDSRRAERTYLQCVQLGRRLMSLGLDIESLTCLEH